uniref:Uncharacterized protein LOC111137971 isoform X2 n=1 Tax=Crassostrea virginica TaxID=6565 RepID=A0A8B8F0V5_CRAVI|nr:uncharacterized protein LOC111137971 isoform X2 [Crassostrea virginica]
MFYYHQDDKIDMKILNTLLLLTYISAFIICRAIATTYYCKDKETINIEGESSGTIHTLASGASKYDNNVDCSWKINAGDGNKIHFKILSSSLEYTPPYTSCFTRDSLFLLSGDSPSSDVLVSICGNFNPFEITSKGQHVYLRFSTNDKNFYDYSGISLQFQTFGNTSCPPGWRELSPLNCFKIMKNPLDGLIWSKAQEYCGYSLSNLIVIPTEDIFTDVQEYAKNVSVDELWIGLNDIETEDSVKWIDGSAVYPSNRLQSSSISDTKDCVIHDTKLKKWVFKYCSREKFPFACQRHKVGETELFKIPEPIEKKEKTRLHRFPWAVSLGAGGAALVIILILIFCVRRKVQNRRNNNYLAGQGEVDRLTLENTERNRLASHRSPNARETGFSSLPPTCSYNI